VGDQREEGRLLIFYLLMILYCLRKYIVIFISASVIEINFMLECF